MISQLELDKPEERRKPGKRVNGIFWILLINLGLFVADHVFQVMIYCVQETLYYWLYIAEIEYIGFLLNVLYIAKLKKWNDGREIFNLKVM